MSGGALAVESAEPQFDFTSDGHVIGVRHEHQTESHRVIEHLMILANEQVARYLSDRKTPTLYRVHERPDPQSVEFMIEQLASLDIPTPPVPEVATSSTSTAMAPAPEVFAVMPRDAAPLVGVGPTELTARSPPTLVATTAGLLSPVVEAGSSVTFTVPAPVE